MTADHKVVSARFRIHLLSNPGFLFFIMLGFFCLAPASPQGNHITDSLSVLLKQSKRQAALLNKIAAEYNHISYSGALGIATEALEAARKEGNEHEAAYAWYNMACNYMSRGAYDSSGIMLERSLRLAEKLNDELAILRVGNANASISFLKGRLDESFRGFESTLERARGAGFTEIIISAVANIGRIHWLQGRNESALRCYDEALSMADSVKNKFMSGMIRLFRGILYQAMGFYELAAGSISVSAAVFEHMNYLDKLPYAYNYLGSVYMDLGENENAMTFFRKALVLFERNNDIWGKALTARFMGSIYSEKGRPDSAGFFIRESLALAARLNDLNGMLFSRRFLAELMLKTGKPDSARVLLLGNLEDALKTDNRQEMVNNLYDLGRVYTLEGRYSPALSYFHRAGTLSDSLGYFHEGMLVSKHLSDLYEKLGDYAKALYWNKRYKSLADTIFSTEKRRSVDELRLKYETEKKNSEISTLMMEKKVQDENLRTQRILGYALFAILGLVLVATVILWRNYRQKKKSEREKEILLKEIHHRVKNNLQTISSLLSLQSYNIADPGVKIAVKESQERVKSMALIHQMLYQQEKLSEIDFGLYLQRLAESVSSGYGDKAATISYHVDCNNVALDIDTAIPLGLIANELIVNAYKYAFTGKTSGNILISLSRNSNNKCLFRIKDNGIGIPGHISPEGAGTLGLRLVSLLVRQIKGAIVFSGVNGTEITITF